MKNFLIGTVLVLLLLIGATWWSKSLQSNDPDVITRSGVHWHPQLTIYVKDEKWEIPANIGVGIQNASKPTYDPSMRMTAMHTHEPDGTIHLEFPGIVKREDTKLGNFFDIWGEDIMEFGSSITMTVNGETNTDIGNYEMKDGDKIELRYE